MITWIPVKERLPKTHSAVDSEGLNYITSDMVLVWDGDKDCSLGVGCYEDGRWFIDGIGSDEVTHWAHINKPDGHLLQQEYMG